MLISADSFFSVNLKANNVPRHFQLKGISNIFMLLLLESWIAAWIEKIGEICSISSRVQCVHLRAHILGKAMNPPRPPPNPISVKLQDRLDPITTYVVPKKGSGLSTLSCNRK